MTTMWKQLPLALLLVAATVAAASARDATTTSTSDDPVIDWYLGVDFVEVSLYTGSKLVFQNTDDSKTHTVSQTNADGGSTPVDSGDIDAGEVWVFAPEEAGDIEFVCAYHASMSGVLHVYDEVTDDGTQQVLWFLGVDDTMIEVNVGDSVVFFNSDTTKSHTVTATDDSFDSGNMDPGDMFVYTAGEDDAGRDIEFVCDYHSSMTGTISVSA